MAIAVESITRQSTLDTAGNVNELGRAFSTRAVGIFKKGLFDRLLVLCAFIFDVFVIARSRARYLGKTDTNGDGNVLIEAIQIIHGISRS